MTTSVYTADNPLDLIDNYCLLTQILIKFQGLEVGHVALNINGQTYGYYPQADINAAYTLVEGISSIMGGPGLQGEIEKYPESYFVNSLYPQANIDAYTINLTSQQEKELRSYMEYTKTHPGYYKLLSNNCTTVVEEAIKNVLPITDPNRNLFNSTSPFDLQMNLNNAVTKNNALVSKYSTIR